MSVTAPEQIPTDLLELANWVVWRYVEADNGKPTKVPFQSRNTRVHASSTSSATWSTFEVAQAAVERDSTLEGLGFVFTQQTGITGIDIDACIDPETGEMEAWAKKIVRRMDTYTEISPSGFGVKLWCYAEAPNRKRNVHKELPPWPHGKPRGLEMYDRERYFAVTGRRWPGTPLEVNERQDVIDALFNYYWPEDEQEEQPAPLPSRPNTVADRELLEKAFSSTTNGRDIEALYRGEKLPQHAGDDSAADLALCNHLAFYTGRDAARMDALFRASGLMRKKWDERHGKLTYGQMTIQKAIEATRETYSPGGNGVRAEGTFGRMGEDAPPEVDPETGEIILLPGRELLGRVMREGSQPTNWLIEPVLVRGRIHLIYGEPESGKTVMALRWLLDCVSAGQDVLYVDEESGVVVVANLLMAMGADPELVDKHVHYFAFPGIDKESYGALLMYADSLQPALVLFDSLTDMLSVAGLDENSGIEVTGWMLDVAQALARRDYQPAVGLIDHVTKDTANVKYSVASRAKKAKSDVLWYVEKQADFDQTKTAPVDLYRHKNRPGVLPKKLRYIIGGQDGKLICERFDISQHGISALSEKAQQVLAAIDDNGGEMLTGHVARLFSVSRETVGKWAKELLQAGHIERFGEARNAGYRIVRSDDSDRQVDDARSSDESSDFVPLIGDDLTILERVTIRQKRRMPEEWE